MNALFPTYGIVRTGIHYCPYVLYESEFQKKLDVLEGAHNNEARFFTSNKRTDYVVLFQSLR